MCFEQNDHATNWAANNWEDEFIRSHSQPSTEAQTLGIDAFCDSDLKACSWQDGPARRADFPKAPSPQKETILIHAMK